MSNQFTINKHALEMFQSGQGADCVIEVMPQIHGQEPEKKEFNVHKYVLMVNSDVFMAMFSHENSQEAREGRIQITDSNGNAVRQMLTYMYTGALPTEYAIETDAGPLLHIANKYQIQSLVQFIEKRLVNSLSLTNVLDRLGLADLYQAKSLYSACGQLIQSNLKTVKKEAKWLELKKKAPELAFTILEDMDEFGIENLHIPENSSNCAIKLTMGTNVIKFAAPNGNDTMHLYGSQPSLVPTKLMCISGMKEYECQSLEELRIADYLAGGTPLFGQEQGAGLFGQGLARPSGGIFTGSTTSTVSAFPFATTATTSLFGTQTVSAEPSGSIFSQTSSQSQQQTTGIFGQQQSAVVAPLSNLENAGPSTLTSMAKQQHERPQFGLHQNPLNIPIDTGNTHNFGNDLKEQKLMNANLEPKNQALHAKMEKAELMAQEALENLDLKAENRALKEDAEQNTDYQTLEAEMKELPNMLTEQQKQMMAQVEALEAKLSTQNEKYQKLVEQLEYKNRMLEEKLRNFEFAEKENGTLDGKMEQLKDECSNSKKLPGLDEE